jgi:2-succinyl-6-hydroxy-2,4-cyclohexadiene-1-carboxylate synthase
LVSAPALVLVPGFLQRSGAWSEVAALLGPRAVALEPRAHTAGTLVEEMSAATPVGAVLVGYSLGGRLALRAALADPGRLAGLVLVGAHAGIDDPAARRARRRADEELAAWMAARPIEEVVARWEAQPIFATQPTELVARQRRDRLSHDPRRLAALLRDAGQGAMPPVWDRVPALDLPVLLVAGELDRPYVDAQRRMAELIPRARAVAVPGAGHAAHLERPEEVASLLLDFVAGLDATPPA